MHPELCLDTISSILLPNFTPENKLSLLKFRYFILCVFLFTACKSKRELLETFPDGSIKKVRDYTSPDTWYEREYYVSGDI
jgi:hypothetical protein